MHQGKFRTHFAAPIFCCGCYVCLSVSRSLFDWIEEAGSQESWTGIRKAEDMQLKDMEMTGPSLVCDFLDLEHNWID